ncbi:hypothetical protein [Parasedimentitalea psychrophila]|uniref:Uncharacterized protein n=1 Tax=Parasedimentitalea psychrophila TaxID=2997337 RepID=A0A9Y2KY90_9RHOB|nr:hypothetical protein [Parasedimentitalea psychrophila]WIY23359.1 hypothetical protein QPJ95_11850 [Parasedimentitalea psychrophila]
MVALSPKTIMTGNPPSAGYEPRKSDIADWMQEYESIAAGGGLAYIDGALVDLQARAGAVDDQFGLVLNTSDEAGVYERIAGAWVKNAAIPTLFLESAFADLAVESAAAAALSEAQAASASSEAESFKAQAELAALAAGARIFASEAAGLAATVEGEVFIVQSGSATKIYQNLSAAAVLLGSAFDKSDLLQAANNLSDIVDAAAARVALGVDPAGKVNTVDLTSDVTGVLPGGNMAKADDTQYGVVQRSTSAQNNGATVDNRFPSVLGVKQMIDTHASAGWHDIPVTLPGADWSSLIITGLSQYSELRVQLASSNTGSSGRISCSGREPAGTWREIARGHSRGGGQFIMNTFQASNFNQADGTVFKFGQVLARGGTGILVLNAAFSGNSSGNMNAGISTFDEVFDELMIDVDTGVFNWELCSVNIQGFRS